MGADYRGAHQSILGGATDAAQPVNVTWYYSPNGGVAGGGFATREVFVDVNGTIRGLRAHASGAPGVGETFDYVLVVNGVPTALTCQTAGAVDTESEDLVNEIAVEPGDSICIAIATSLNAAVMFHTFGLVLRC